MPDGGATRAENWAAYESRVYEQIASIAPPNRDGPEFLIAAGIALKGGAKLVGRTTLFKMESGIPLFAPRRKLS